MSTQQITTAASDGTAPGATALGATAPGRRSVMAAAGLVPFAACALAACGGSSSSSSADAAGGSGSDVSGTLTALSAVPVGGTVVIEASGTSVVVAQPTAGQAVAFLAACPHQGCTVALQGSTLVCPCHGSEFDALTGTLHAGTGKATTNLVSVPVTVTDGNVVA